MAYPQVVQPPGALPGYGRAMVEGNTHQATNIPPSYQLHPYDDVFFFDHALSMTPGLAAPGLQSHVHGMPAGPAGHGSPLLATGPPVRSLLAPAGPQTLPIRTQRRPATHRHHRQRRAQAPYRLPAALATPSSRQARRRPSPPTAACASWVHASCAMAHLSEEPAALTGAGSSVDLAPRASGSPHTPEVTGSPVGQLQPSTAITQEYAAADPIYQIKTAALPRIYSHYRTLRGDGRCGWRAIAFGYFEALVRLNNAPHTFIEAQARLKSVRIVGVEDFIFEGFADYVFELLDSLSGAANQDDAARILLETFTDEEKDQYIVAYMKILTSSWMQNNQEHYAPFLENCTVEQYCKNSVEPIAAEIDDPSIKALFDVLLSYAGVSLEVIYLDRSQSNEVNAAVQHEPGPDYPTVGTIRLLYRPGHYDLLYKPEDLVLQVSAYFQHVSSPTWFPDGIGASFLHQPAPNLSSQPYFEPYNDSCILTCIPGSSRMSHAPNDTNWLWSGHDSILESPAWAMTPLPTATPSIQSASGSMPNVFETPAFASAAFGYTAPLSMELPANMQVSEQQAPFPGYLHPQVQPGPSKRISNARFPGSSNPSGLAVQFRKSQAQYDYEMEKSQTQPDHVDHAHSPPMIKQSPLTTNPMKQGPCYEPHYQNENFQPIMYDPCNPEASTTDHNTRPSRPRGVKRTTDHT